MVVIILLFFILTISIVLANNVVKVGVILPLSKDSVPLPDGEQKLLAFIMAINDAKTQYAKQNITVRYTIRDSQGHYGLAGMISILLYLCCPWDCLYTLRE